MEKGSFKELYEMLYDNNKKELEILDKKEKKQASINGIIFLLWLVIPWFICYYSIPLGIILFIVGIIILFKMGEKQSKNKNTYYNLFNKNIFIPLINYAYCNVEYSEQGINELEYCWSKWEKHGLFTSRDKISININLTEKANSKLVISEIFTEKVKKDSNGNSPTLFEGIACYIELPKDIGCYIKISNELNKEGYDINNKLNMDSEKFEEVFNTETDDKIKTMQFLTSDIMLEILNLQNICKSKFEIYICNNMMHMRFHIEEISKCAQFGKKKQLEELEKYFNTINSVKQIIEHIGEMLVKTEF